jgi:hypothetical protein
MAKINLKKLQENTDAIAKTITSILGLGSAFIAFLTTTQNWFLDNPDLPIKFLWVSVIAFVILGIVLIIPRTVQKPRKRLVWKPPLIIILALALIVGIPMAGYFIDQKVFQLSPQEAARVKTLKDEAIDQMHEDKRAAKELLKEAQKIAPRDPEIKKLLDELENK